MRDSDNEPLFWADTFRLEENKRIESGFQRLKILSTQKIWARY